ncbi:hypothetical protein KAX17_11490 [Candidatus Bipolaricaulota bacterium]|nr:hypothetical protein [Candidatus Bipolaricaulota bacterium]
MNTKKNARKSRSKFILAGLLTLLLLTATGFSALSNGRLRSASSMDTILDVLLGMPINFDDIADIVEALAEGDAETLEHFFVDPTSYVELSLEEYRLVTVRPALGEEQGVVGVSEIRAPGLEPASVGVALLVGETLFTIQPLIEPHSELTHSDRVFQTVITLDETGIFDLLLALVSIEDTSAVSGGIPEEYISDLWGSFWRKEAVEIDKTTFVARIVDMRRAKELDSMATSPEEELVRVHVYEESEDEKEFPEEGLVIVTNRMMLVIQRAFE